MWSHLFYWLDRSGSESFNAQHSTLLLNGLSLIISVEVVGSIGSWQGHRPERLGNQFLTILTRGVFSPLNKFMAGNSAEWVYKLVAPSVQVGLVTSSHTHTRGWSSDHRTLIILNATQSYFKWIEMTFPILLTAAAKLSTNISERGIASPEMITKIVVW